MFPGGGPAKIASAVFHAIPGRPRRQKNPQEPVFASPPLWIHASLAAKCFLGKESPLLISRRREAKRRALLQMLDRLPVRSERAVSAPKPARVPAADIPLPRNAAPEPRIQK